MQRVSRLTPRGGLRPSWRGLAHSSIVRADPVKQSTGLTGLAVVPNAREVLVALYNKTLKEFETQLPEGGPYRSVMENLTRERLKVVEENESIAKIEEIIDCGQVEQLIQQAQDELELIPVMARTKPWIHENPHHQVAVVVRDI